jgi:hypothetical protein
LFHILQSVNFIKTSSTCLIFLGLTFLPGFHAMVGIFPDFIPATLVQVLWRMYFNGAHVLLTLLNLEGKEAKMTLVVNNFLYNPWNDVETECCTNGVQNCLHIPLTVLLARLCLEYPQQGAKRPHTASCTYVCACVVLSGMSADAAEFQL